MNTDCATYQVIVDFCKERNTRILSDANDVNLIKQGLLIHFSLSNVKYLVRAVKDGKLSEISIAIPVDCDLKQIKKELAMYEQIS